MTNDVDRLIPTYKYSQAKGVDKSSHPDRDDYIALQGLISPALNTSKVIN
jgi:biofilm PGA synthesis protein PgaA